MSAPAAADRNRLTLETTTEVDVTPLGSIPVVTTNQRWRVFIGETTRTELGPGDFFRVVEREDLARRYERRRTFGFAALGTAAAAGLVGGFLITRDDRDRYAAAGFMTLTGGLIAAVAGGVSLYTANPTSESEAREMVDVHNARTQRRVTWSAYPVLGGGGISAGGSF